MTATPKHRSQRDMDRIEDDLLTEQALQEGLAGYGVPADEVIAWVDSWFTDNPLPPPEVRKLW